MFHLSFFLAENARGCKVVLSKLASFTKRAGFSCVRISSDRSCGVVILLKDPSFTPVFLWDPDIFLTTPLMLKLFSLFFNSFHLLAFYSFLLAKSVIVFIDEVLSVRFLTEVIISFLLSFSIYSACSSFGIRRSRVIPFCLNMWMH